MTSFGTYIRTILDLGREEARQDGSASVEAQHLLLAMAAGPDAAPRRVLAAAGLDHQAIREALDREFEHSLAVAGVQAATFDLPQASRAPSRREDLGASARLAIERGFSAGAGQKGASRKDLRPAHLLLGILRAEAGTVPRALTLAGIDRAGLAERARQSLAAPPA